MIILGTNSIKDTGYDVANSARFENSSSDYLNRTPSSTSNRKTFTFSFWVKRTKLGTNDTIYNVRPGGLGANRLSFHSTTDTFRIALEPISKFIFTTRKFRDVSAWYHIVAAFDTTQGTASDRVKIYINGVQEGSLVKGDGGAATYPDQNTDLDINTTNVINLGRDLETSSDFIDMYLAEFVFIDGQQLAPTSFGEFDEDSGIWKPIDVSGLTFGTNGFYLDFEDSSALGNDVSGNDNDFTVNNLTAIDQSTDTCTNNFATFNPLAVWRGQNTTPSSVLEEGNLKVAIGSSEVTLVASTFGVTSGKWYWESKSNGVGRLFSGFVNKNAFGNTSEPHASTNSAGISYYEAVPDFRGNSGDGGITTGVVSISSGDVLGFALDMDNFAFYISKNGTYMNSGNPTSGSNKTGAISELFTNGSQYLSDHGEVFPCCYVQSTDFVGTASYNFGSPPYSESGGNSDGNGYGNFKTAPPSGYYALNTKNLAEYG